MNSEKIVGTLSGGDGFTLDEAEGFCKAMHADAVIVYSDGIVRVLAVRAQEVS